MSKRFADTELAEIAKELDSENFPPFETPLPAHLSDNVASRARQGMFKGISRLSLTKWVVRVSISGVQYVVGRTTSPETAMRFSDMAQMYFFPYRKHNAAPPTSRQLNFSVDQAKLDLKEEITAKQILTSIEALLEQRKVLDYEEGKRARLLADTASLRIAGVDVAELKSQVPETTAIIRRSIRTDHHELVKRVESLEAGQHQLVQALSLLRERIGTVICKPEKGC